MGLIKSLVFGIIFTTLLAVTGGCASPPPPPFSQTGEIPTVRIIISRDFGQTILKNKIVEISGNNDALSVLKKAAQVETGYGGGFVNGIDGLRTSLSGGGGQKRDWFFYINGMEANTGAADYPLFNGDIEHWDFHNWGFRHMVPAVIGHFPEPFINGCRGKVNPTLVAYQADYEKQANDVAGFLAQLGAADIKSVRIDFLAEEDKKTHNLIVLAGQQEPLIVELNRQWKRLGFFAFFENNRLVTIDQTGERKQEYSENTGLIQATQNPWNPSGIGANENTVWIVSGCDQIGLDLATDCLLNNLTEWRYSWGVVVKQGEIIKLP